MSLYVTNLSPKIFDYLNIFRPCSITITSVSTERVPIKGLKNTSFAKSDICILLFSYIITKSHVFSCAAILNGLIALNVINHDYLSISKGANFC